MTSNHRTADDQPRTPTLERWMKNPNGEFSPFRTAAAIIGILLAVIGTIGWFWVLNVQAQQTVIETKLSDLDTEVTVHEAEHKKDMEYIKEQLKDIKTAVER